jgi:hypothetical protein
MGKIRDPNRIAPMMERIKRLWESNPELRFYQLMGNVSKVKDPYYVEDSELMRWIEEYEEERG